MDTLSFFLNRKKILLSVILAMVLINGLPSNSSVLSYAIIIYAYAQEDSSAEDGVEEPPTDGVEEPPTDGVEEPPTDEEEEPPTDEEEEPPTDEEEEPPTDTTPPVITVPADITAEAISEGGA